MPVPTGGGCGPPSAFRVGGARGERGCAAALGEVLLDDPQSFADLQDHRGVHDVLGGRAPEDVVPRLAALILGPVERNWDRVAGDVRATHKVDVDGRGVGEPGDLGGGLGRDDGAARWSNLP